MEGYQYDAYGKATVFTGKGNDNTWFTSDDTTANWSAKGNPYQYTGQRYDAETQLYYYKNRYFDTDLGRFTSRDHIGYEDSMNLYEYAHGSPIIYADAMGLDVGIIHAPSIGGSGGGLSNNPANDICNSPLADCAGGWPKTDLPTSPWPRGPRGPLPGPVFPNGTPPDIRPGTNSSLNDLLLSIMGGTGKVGDFIDCIANCIDEHDPLSKIEKAAGFGGARVPKKFPTNVSTKSIWELRILRKIFGHSIRAGMKLGKAFMPLTLLEGGYMTGVEFGCIGLCLNLGEDDDCSRYNVGGEGWRPGPLP